MHALRLARGYTGRDKYIKFEGAYHGVHDYVLYSMYANPAPVYGSRRSPIPVPESSGIPKAINNTVITVPYNDCEALDMALKRSWQLGTIQVDYAMPESFDLEYVGAQMMIDLKHVEQSFGDAVGASVHETAGAR